MDIRPYDINLCDPCNHCDPHHHDCCGKERRHQPPCCGPVDTTKMCDIYDVQHCGCECGHMDCGYKFPPLAPIPPEFASLTETQQLYCLDKKMNELICMFNGHNKKLEQAYCEIVNSAKCNDAYYWREIKTEEGYLEEAGSSYKVVHIPFLDCGGEPIYLELGLAYNNTTNSGIKEDVFSCSQRTFADKLVPAMNTADKWVGATIFKGAPIENLSEETPDCMTVGVTHSGFIKVYKNLKDYKQTGMDKIRNAMMANSILMEGGNTTPDNYGADKAELLPRVGMGMNYATKERFIIIIDSGATADMLAKLFEKYQCTVAAELATADSAMAMDKGAFMYMPASVQPTTNPTVPEINAFWYITKRRHYHNDYVRDVASLTQKFGEQLWRTALTNGVVDNLKLSVADLYNKIAEETERAEAAEAQLQKNIEAETARATAAEEQLQNNIEAETTRAEAAEQELDERITEEVNTLNTRIDTEVAELEAADTALRELINSEVQKLTQALADETTARTNADIASVERVEEDANRVLYKLVRADGTRIDLPVEVYDYADLVLQLQKFDEYDQRINAEAEARKQADDALGAEIDTERNERQAADTELDGKITAEVNRATQAEAALDGKITAETARATEAEENLENKIGDEATQRQEADTNLQGQVDEIKEQIDGDINTTIQEILGTFNNYLPLAGGTMTGPVTLAGDPTAELQAATKKYVDEHGASIPAITEETLITDIGSGFYLVLSNGHKIPIMIGLIGPKGFIYSQGSFHIVENVVDMRIKDLTSQYLLYGISIESDENCVTVNGHRIVGVLEPSDSADAATKNYVDTAVAQAGGIPEYSLTDKVKGIKSGFIIINSYDTLYPALYCQYGESGSAILITADGCFYKKAITDELTFDDLMLPANAFVDPGDEYLITKKYADQTYTNKDDYQSAYDLLNIKVQDLESTVATLTQTVATMQSTITQLKGNALTTLDRQTLDVLENKLGV